MLDRKINVHSYGLVFTLVCTLGIAIYSPETHASSKSEKSKSKERPLFIPDYGGFVRDVSIGKVDGVELTANLAVPIKKQRKPVAAIVLIHGGGFVSGTKDRFNKHLAKYAERLNMVALSPFYRLAPEWGFPAAVEDVKASIRFLKANAEALNLDPDRIIVAGSSAGGYLSAMVAVTGNDDSFSKNGLYTEYDSRVHFAMVRSAPIGDLTQQFEDKPGVIKRLFKGYGISEEQANRLASPLTYLDENDPPMLISHGDADPRIPVQMSRDFVAQLALLNIDHDYYEVEGGSHSLSKSRPAEARKIKDKFNAIVKEIARSK